MPHLVSEHCLVWGKLLTHLVSEVLRVQKFEHDGSRRVEKKHRSVFPFVTTCLPLHSSTDKSSCLWSGEG